VNAKFLAILLSIHENADMAMVNECIRECGKTYGVRIVVESDADIEGVMCECAETPPWMEDPP
jgi:hypothetical protein